MQIPNYPEADSLEDGHLIGYGPKPGGAPGEMRTTRFPTSLFSGSLWSFQGVLSVNGDYIHIYTLGGAYKGSMPLVNLEQGDL